MSAMYRDRIYRLDIKDPDGGFRVKVQETDCFVHAPGELAPLARELILESRGYIENYIRRNPEFADARTPWRIDMPAPAIIQEMAEAGEMANVGPMAAVAGAVAEFVGKGLLSHVSEVVVENGGDIFVKKKGPVTFGIFAGPSPLSMKIGMRIIAGNEALAVCTSSGTVGHSFSYGKADAVCVVCPSCPLADAVATATGNLVLKTRDIPEALAFARSIPSVTGIVIIKGDQIAIWGDLEIVPV